MTLEEYALYDEIQRRIHVAQNFPDSDRAQLDVAIYTLAQKALEKPPEPKEPVAWLLVDFEGEHKAATCAKFTLNFYKSKGFSVIPLGIIEG